MLIAFGGGMVVDRTVFGTSGCVTPAASPASAASSGVQCATSSNAPLQGFDIYNDALDLIKSKFVNRSQVDDKTLLYGSIKGMVDALGDTGHSVFLTPQEYQQAQQNLSGQLTGIGVIGTDTNGSPAVLRVLPGSPADKAGLKAGDVIVAVDGSPTSGKAFSDVASTIRGPAGTKVKLSILHAGTATPVDVTVTRAVITVPLVDWAIVPGTKIADITLFEFGSGASDQVKQAIAAARSQGATGIVLDLRGNPGGLVSEAIGVASQFLSSGNVYIEVDAQGKRTEVGVDTKQTHVTLPLVVIVDGNSASASEIVTGAIQDAHRAQVVGTKTFGTGTVLQAFTLPDGSAIYLGVREWLTPAGRRIFGNGLTPDDDVPLPAGATPTDPLDLKDQTLSQIQSSKDTQLLEALKLLEQ